MRLRERIGISQRRQQQLSYAMEVGLVAIVVVGFYERNTTVVVNGLVGFAVTQIPPLLKRDFDIPMDTGLTLWITAAVFFHAFGVLGLPGAEENLYGSTVWWDHFTHALSASVVAAAGYATARALDIYSTDIHLPARFMFVFILLFVVAFGVVWEVIEFGLGELARIVGNRPLLTQGALEDSMKDLVFDTIGGVVVGIWGTVHLTDVSGAVAAYLDRRHSE